MHTHTYSLAVLFSLSLARAQTFPVTVHTHIRTRTRTPISLRTRQSVGLRMVQTPLNPTATPTTTPENICDLATADGIWYLEQVSLLSSLRIPSHVGISIPICKVLVPDTLIVASELFNFRLYRCVLLCVFVCVRDRERERERKCLCVRAYVLKCVCDGLITLIFDQMFTIMVDQISNFHFHPLIKL